MTTRDILIKARGLIEKPEAWGKMGKEICAGIAIERSVVKDEQGDWETTKKVLAVFFSANRIPVTWNTTSTVIDWNDAPDRTHAEVLAAFDRAIAATAP